MCHLYKTFSASLCTYIVKQNYTFNILELKIISKIWLHSLFKSNSPGIFIQLFMSLCRQTVQQCLLSRNYVVTRHHNYELLRHCNYKLSYNSATSKLCGNTRKRQIVQQCLLSRNYELSQHRNCVIPPP